jgi:spermidine/putrescine transport system ATP-binding protein
MVHIDDLVKKFNDVTAVDNISFDVKSGEFFSLLGPSGCGKTTTLRCIAGFEDLSGGEIYINNELVNQVPAYERNTGMVFQDYALFPHKTVYENIAFGLKMDGVSQEKKQDRVRDALELVNLPGLQERYPDELSGGQQQRIALARAIITEPSLLLLDEPLSNLDLKLRKNMRIELKKIQEELDITTIYVTHDQEEALSMSDRIMVMKDGNNIQIDEPQEIYNSPENRFVAEFIGESNIFSAEVSSVSSDRVEVELNLNRERLASEAINNGSYSVGEEVIISARPEDGRINSGSTKHMNGTLVTKTFLGNITQYVLNMNGKEIMIESSRTEDYDKVNIGAEVEVTWDDFVILPSTKQL